MNLTKLHVCPVCGKLPRAKRNIFGKTFIQCKSRFQKPHLAVEVRRPDFLNPKSEAIGTWNEAAKKMAESREECYG